MLVRLDPFAPWKNFNSLIDELNAPTKRSSEPQARVPNVRAEATEDGWLLEAELPGIRSEDVSIEVLKNTLLVEATRVETEKSAKADAGEEGDEPALRVRSQRRFAFRYGFPQRIDADSVEARMEHGVLTVSLKAAVDERPRKISVLPSE